MSPNSPTPSNEEVGNALPLKSSLALVAGVLAAASLAHATIDISTVYVGDPGNANDSTGYGGVSYGYHVGTYEVTTAEYVAFLNAVAATDPNGLYNTEMAQIRGGRVTRSGASGSYTYATTNPNHPANNLSFWDAARFTNWLTSGDTETGVYVLTTDGIANNTITRNATAWANGGVAITSENEWYKAAYYQPATAGGDTDNYWLYPTRSNSISTADAQYDEGAAGVPVTVGSYANRPSYYGTFDQGGNVFEWNGTIVGANRGVRGGSYSSPEGQIASTSRPPFGPNNERHVLGFRVSSLSLANLPEPSAYTAICGLLGLALALARRQTIADRKAQA